MQRKVFSLIKKRYFQSVIYKKLRLIFKYISSAEIKEKTLSSFVKITDNKITLKMQKAIIEFLPKGNILKSFYLNIGVNGKKICLGSVWNPNSSFRSISYLYRLTLKLEKALEIPATAVAA